jgi:hypothetical protein
MPPLLASRVWVDFRHVDGPDYLARVRELARALQGGRAGPPPPTGALGLPPGSGFRAAGPRSLRLSIGPERIALSGENVDVAGPPPGGGDLEGLCWRLRHAQAQWEPLREAEISEGLRLHCNRSKAAIAITIHHSGDRWTGSAVRQRITLAEPRLPHSA